jgi:hypothetical protein
LQSFGLLVQFGDGVGCRSETFPERSGVTRFR